MRKLMAVASLSVACLTLTACGMNKQTNQSSKIASLRAENASLQKQINGKHHRPAQAAISDEEYAMMGYLELESEDESIAGSVNNLRDNHDNMHWWQKGNKYFINFGAHTTTMTVSGNNVEVTFDDTEGDHMGNQNGHRTYTKAELKKEFGKYKDIIDQILHGDNSKSENSNSAMDNDSTHATTKHSSTSHHDDDDDDDDNDTDDDNYDDDDDQQTDNNDSNNQQSNNDQSSMNQQSDDNNQ